MLSVTGIEKFNANKPQIIYYRCQLLQSIRRWLEKNECKKVEDGRKNFSTKVFPRISVFFFSFLPPKDNEKAIHIHEVHRSSFPHTLACSPPIFLFARLPMFFILSLVILRFKLSQSLIAGHLQTQRCPKTSKLFSKSLSASCPQHRAFLIIYASLKISSILMRNRSILPARGFSAVSLQSSQSIYRHCHVLNIGAPNALSTPPPLLLYIC